MNDERYRDDVRTQPIVPPIYQTTSFRLDDQSYEDIQDHGGLREIWYSRFGNPTVQAPAAEIASLEGGEAAIMTSSGMAAIATTLLTTCSAGDRIVASREIYGDTRDLLVRDLPRLGITVDFVSAGDETAWENALKTPARVVYAETLSNPQLALLDVPHVARLAREAGATFVVDNTFASPYMIRPLEHGVDVVVHSVTKFLNGHSDVTAGCVVGSDSFVRDVQRRLVTFGGVLDPHAAYLVHRGLKTFAVRIDRQCRTAIEIARFLEQRPEVTRVLHPSLESYPYRELASRLTNGRSGAVVTFVVEGGEEHALRLLRNLEVAWEATSLGGVETLASMPINSSHFMLSQEELDLAGINPGMIRLSVGVEEPALLTTDFARAFDRTREAQIA